MSKYVAVDDVYKAFAALDWQDLYLPIHFKEIFDEIPTVPKDWHDEQDVRNAYTDGFSEGIHRGYEDAVHNYSKLLTEMRERWIPVTDRLPPDGRYLCRSDAGIHSVLECTDGKFNVFRQKNGELYDKHEIKDIAYWMPLPEPPEEEET